MTPRRSAGSGGWTVKKTKTPLWKYVHPVKHLKNEARRARRQMRPSKVLGRFFSVPEIRSAVGTKTVRVNAETRRKQAVAAEKKPARPAPAKKAAAKGKKQDPYAAALAIPERNRKTGTAMAKAQQPAKKTVPVRRKDGKFDGRKAMPAHELEAYTRAQQPTADPALFTRDLRGRRTR